MHLRPGQTLSLTSMGRLPLLFLLPRLPRLPPLPRLLPRLLRLLPGRLGLLGVSLRKAGACCGMLCI